MVRKGVAFAAYVDDPRTVAVKRAIGALVASECRGSASVIIHINGWPGTGKHTVGRIVACHLGARFVHNHVLHDVAIVCAGYDDPGRWPLYDEVREAAYRTLLNRPAEETFVMTNALCTNSPRERAVWNHVVDLAIARRLPLVPVVLEASSAENERRVASPDRQGRKLTDPGGLRSMRETDTIQRPLVPELLVLDTTEITAEEAASAVMRHVVGQRKAGPLPPARECHRRLASIRGLRPDA